MILWWLWLYHLVTGTMMAKPKWVEVLPTRFYHLATSTTLLKRGEVGERLQETFLSCKEAIRTEIGRIGYFELIAEYNTIKRINVPSVTNRDAITINTVPVDFSSHLHWELADFASPEDMTEEWKQKTYFLNIFMKYFSSMFHLEEHRRGTECLIGPSRLPTSGLNKAPGKKPPVFWWTYKLPIFPRYWKPPLGHHPPVKPLFSCNSVVFLSWQGSEADSYSTKLLN